MVVKPLHGRLRLFSHPIWIEESVEEDVSSFWSEINRRRRKRQPYLRWNDRMVKVIPSFGVPIEEGEHEIEAPIRKC